MSDIVLTAGVRQNLLALQNTARLMGITQNRLATGKAVNTALDNPVNFFTAAGLHWPPARRSIRPSTIRSISSPPPGCKAAPTT